MHKISFPKIGDYNIPAFYLLKNILKQDIIMPPNITNKTIEIGNKYSPETVCTPFKYTLGTLIEVLDKGADTIIQLGGGCRYGYYGEVQEKIIKDLGYKCTFINLITEGKMNIKRVYKSLKKINKKINIFKSLYYLFITYKMIKYMDILDDYIRENIGFETKKGSFEELKLRMLKDFSKVKGYRNLKKTYKKYVDLFLNVHIHKPDNNLKIGIIGELYTLMEPFSNYFLEKELAKNNIEIKRFTNATNLVFKKTKPLKYLKNIKYSMGADSNDNILRSIYLCKNHYDGIIHIKSSFCTPEISIMPILNKISENYNVPIIYFSFDANTSETGIKTRLEAFYDMLEMRKNNE